MGIEISEHSWISAGMNPLQPSWRALCPTASELVRWAGDLAFGLPRSFFLKLRWARGTTRLASHRLGLG